MNRGHPTDEPEVAGASTSDMPKIIGHRGVGHFAPENTLIAFRKAIEYDLDGIEFDLWKTSDDELVVIHDWNSYRTTGQRYTIEETDSDLLAALPADSSYTDRTTAYSIDSEQDAKCRLSFPFFDEWFPTLCVEIEPARIRQVSKATREGPLSFLPDSWGQQLSHICTHDPPGRINDTANPRPTVPLFEEVLELVSETEMTLLIDLKGALQQDPTSVQELLSAYEMESQAIYLSWESNSTRRWQATVFDLLTKPLQWLGAASGYPHMTGEWEGLQRLKQAHPETESRTALHYQSRRIPGRSLSLCDAIETAERIDVDIFVGNYAQVKKAYPDGVEGFWRDVSARDMQPAVSSVGHQPDRLTKLVELGVEYISTNRFDLVREELQNEDTTETPSVDESDY